VHGRAMGNDGFTRFIMSQIWRKPPPSPLWYILCMATRPTPKCHFVLGFPSGSLEIPKVGTFVTLGATNFVCRSPIKMRFKTKL